MPAPPGPEQNFLLASLPAAEQKRLFPNLELVDLGLGAVVHEPYAGLSHAYFPIDCILSTLYEVENGESVESAVIGNEGLAGVAVLLGGGTTPNRLIVQNAGRAYRVKRDVIKAEFDRHGAAHDLFLRYIQFLLTQTSQTAVCYRHHVLEQQLCRLILLCMDRINGKRLCMTQQFIADMLGVRREGVTQAARKLQGLGLIAYHRGDIDILDRAGLEKLCCECYPILKAEFDRLLSYLPPATESA